MALLETAAAEQLHRSTGTRSRVINTVSLRAAVDGLPPPSRATMYRAVAPSQRAPADNHRQLLGVHTMFGTSSCACRTAEGASWTLNACSRIDAELGQNHVANLNGLLMVLNHHVREHHVGVVVGGSRGCMRSRWRTTPVQRTMPPPCPPTRYTPRSRATEAIVATPVITFLALFMQDLFRSHGSYVFLCSCSRSACSRYFREHLDAMNRCIGRRALGD